MPDVLKSLRRLAAELSGTTAMEYALLGALVAVVIIVAVQSMATEVQALFQTVVDAFPPL